MIIGFIRLNPSFLLDYVNAGNGGKIALNLKMKSNLQGMKKENHFQENRFWKAAKKRSTLWWKSKDCSHLFMINLSEPIILIPDCKKSFLQVNLCQKLLFLHQLTHNMTTDYSLNYEFSTWKMQSQNMLCTQIVLFFCFDIQNNLCRACNFHLLNL